MRLAPSEVPDGLVLCAAFESPPVALTPSPSTPTIWGDASLDDPWSGPLVATWTSEPSEFPIHDGAEDVVVHGVDGYVAPMPLFQAISSAEWGHIVTWPDPSGAAIEVAARGATAEAAVAIAENVTMGDDATPTLAAGTLGANTAPIYKGVGVSPYLAGSTGGWVLSYGGAAHTLAARADDLRALSVTGFQGGADDLQTLRYSTVASASTTIRGHDAIEYAAFESTFGPFGIAWAETPHLIVQVVGPGLDAATVRSVAESLSPIDATEWKARKGFNPDCEVEAVDPDCETDAVDPACEPSPG